MRSSLVFSLAAIVSVASGCSRLGRASATEIKDGNSESRYNWNATLVTPSELAGAMQVRGVASWARDGSNSKITISISNATSGGVHPWHVHQGRCGDNGAIVGSAEAYKPLSVGSNGQATENASLSMSLPMSGNYYVNVHAAASNMSTTISCGNLAPPVL
ncbi:MAG: hypothetical protein ABI625_01160 [bacterium]